MAFDPTIKKNSLKEAFTAAAGRGLRVNSSHEIGIPDNREPEVSFLLRDMSDADDIYTQLSNSGDVVILPKSARTNPGFLISLGQDTVNAEGYPTREIELSGHTLRSRFSFQATGQSFNFTRFDRSVKSIEKSDSRKEWEASGENPDDGYEQLISENPTLPEIFQKLDPASFRVSGVCITARAMYSFLHIVDADTAVLYDACNDACVMTTPYADAPVGYRREFEYEAKAVFSKRIDPLNKTAINEALNKSINILRSRISASSPDAITSTDESKLAHTQRTVREHYETILGDALTSESHPLVKDGTDHALLQNIKPGAFIHMPQSGNLRILSRLIPAAEQLLPGKIDTDYSNYFRAEHLNQDVLKLVVA